MYVSLGKKKKKKPKVLQNHTLKIGTRHLNLCSFDIQCISMYSEAFQSLSQALSPSRFTAIQGGK